MNLMKVKDVFLDVLFPPICLNCQKHIEERNKLICDRCLAGIEINNSLFCPVCRARLWQDKKICNHGQSDGRQYPFVLAAAANYGNETTQNLITYFKYKGFESLAPILSSFVFKYINFINLDLEDYIIVPIPLHKNRERKRGFNQAKLLADNLSERLEIDSIDALRRIKNTKPQACLSGRQAKLKNQKDDNIFNWLESDNSRLKTQHEKRQENIRGAFKIIDGSLIEGKKIILVDDVYTSGATMGEAARVLKENGAKKIIALVVAKA